MTSRDSACRSWAMCPDSLATRSARWPRVAISALVYHCSFDGDRTDNTAGSVAAPGRLRPEDDALLVVGGGVRHRRWRPVARVRDDAPAHLSVVDDPVLSGEDPVVG